LIKSILWHLKIKNIPTSKNCSLEKTKCRGQLPDGEWIEVQFTPTPIFANVPFEISVQTSSEQVIPTAIDFEGLNLNMGYIRPALTNLNPNKYGAQVTLPVCEEKIMKWNALVLFNLKKEGASITYGMTFFFESKEK
jgi:hypothetical protein